MSCFCADVLGAYKSHYRTFPRILSSYFDVNVHKVFTDSRVFIRITIKMCYSPAVSVFTDVWTFHLNALHYPITSGQLNSFYSHLAFAFILMSFGIRPHFIGWYANLHMCLIGVTLSSSLGRMSYLCLPVYWSVTWTLMSSVELNIPMGLSVCSYAQLFVSILSYYKPCKMKDKWYHLRKTYTFCPWTTILLLHTENNPEQLKISDTSIWLFSLTHQSPHLVNGKMHAS